MLLILMTDAGPETLRSQRLELYPKLWSATAAVSRWPRVQLTRGSLEDLHAALRSWYYAMGGLFLSVSARARYGDVQKLIETLLEHKGNSADVLVVGGYEALMKTASALRTALTRMFAPPKKVEPSKRKWHSRRARA